MCLVRKGMARRWYCGSIFCLQWNAMHEHDKQSVSLREKNVEAWYSRAQIKQRGIKKKPNPNTVII